MQQEYLQSAILAHKHSWGDGLWPLKNRFLTPQKPGPQLRDLKIFVTISSKIIIFYKYHLHQSGPIA